MKKIVTVLGARPQFVKAGVVSQALARSGQFSEVLVHTGQHFDQNMSDVFFSELGLPQPAYNLGIHGGGHGSMTGQMLAELEEVMVRERPDIQFDACRRACSGQVAHSPGACRSRLAQFQHGHAGRGQPHLDRSRVHLAVRAGRSGGGKPASGRHA
jgi:hypothetical protein